MLDALYSGAYASCILMSFLFATFSNILTVKLQGLNFLVSQSAKLTCYEKLLVVDYEPIDCSIPDIDRNLLSKDQQYLLDISDAMTFGHCPEDLANRDPGPLFHSRWLTAANRVLKLYISSSET
ncbi:hypothetical protein AVEN_192268-1 [Araneus ventricosus]|uniref:Uncharacterized protein n=1 Tax=Araneus ventricosus TaxID=182803 RepID=A0A4Y2NQC8_ARAVE|nr:hypothetical protein AVEN_192268-1 [Araneus ventricosus]